MLLYLLFLLIHLSAFRKMFFLNLRNFLFIKQKFQIRIFGSARHLHLLFDSAGILKVVIRKKWKVAWVH